MKTKRHLFRGFSLLEALIVVAVIAIVAGVAMPRMGGLRESVQQAKLDTDVTAVNSAIKVYLANGGNIGKGESPQAIVDKLKTIRDAASTGRFVGLSGSTIDPRLATRQATASDSKRSRAVWNEATQQFEIAESGDGVVEFYLNEALAEIDYGQESRKESALNYNEKAGWIWAYQDRPPTPVAGPTTVPVGSVPSSPPTPASAAPTTLLPPAFAPGGGIFPPSDFPKTVTLTNPNASSTWLLYSVNGSPFIRYSAPFQAAPDSNILAYATGDPSQWINSRQVSAWFQASSPQRLNPPSITLSHTQFNATTTSISVTIGNTDTTGNSQVYYSIQPKGGTFPPQSSWALYSGTFSASSTTYPAGFTVQAFARSTSPQNYLDSTVSERSAGADLIFDDLASGDVLFIIDASSSMNNSFRSTTRFGAVIADLQLAISTLSANQKFSVATFDGSPRWTDGSWQLKDATPANKASMISQVGALTTGSGTNYEAALRFPPLFSPQPTTVVFLTDGEPSSGSDYLDELATLASRGIVVNTIGVALNSTGTQLLTDIANATGGQMRSISN